MPSDIPANDNARRHVLNIGTWKVPKKKWVIEVGGRFFESLGQAEDYARATSQPIYCRLKTKAEKAANQ